MNNKKAKEIMTSNVIVTNKDDTIAEIANLLIQEKIGGLPVVDQDNKVVGIISETDIIKKEKHAETPRMINLLQGIIFIDNVKELEKDLKDISAYKVEDLMSKNIVKVHEEDSVDYVANIMIKKSVNRVPVVDQNDVLKGIICRYDIIKAMYS